MPTQPWVPGTQKDLWWFLLFFYLLFFWCLRIYIFNRVLRRGIAEVLEVLSEVLIVMWWCSGAHRCERWCSVWCGQHSNQSMRVPPPCETLAIALFFRVVRRESYITSLSRRERERPSPRSFGVNFHIRSYLFIVPSSSLFSLSLSALALSALSLCLNPFLFLFFFSPSLPYHI